MFYKGIVFIKYTIIFFTLFFSFYAFALAEELDLDELLKNTPGIDSTTGVVYCIFLRLMTWLFSFALVIAIILLIINGLRYIFASGDPQTLSTVHKNLSWISVGIVIVLLSTSILIMIAMFLGVFTAGFEAIILPIYAVKCEVVWWASLLGNIFSRMGAGI